jgi:hypothetical protein
MQWPFRALFGLLRGADLPSLQRVALVRDPTDLLALPALVVAAWIGAGRLEYRRAVHE